MCQEVNHRNIFFLIVHPVLHHSQPWAKPTPPWASLAGWLLSAPPRAAQKGLKLGQGQQALGGRGQQAPLGASQFLGPRPGSLMETPSEVQLEAQPWSLVAKGTAAGAARTAQTSTLTMREPPSAASHHWKGWIWICARMKGRGQDMNHLFICPFVAISYFRIPICCISVCFFDLPGGEILTVVASL